MNKLTDARLEELKEKATRMAAAYGETTPDWADTVNALYELQVLRRKLEDCAFTEVKTPIFPGCRQGCVRESGYCMFCVRNVCIKDYFKEIE